MLIHCINDGQFPKENDFSESWKFHNPNAEIRYWTFSEAEKILQMNHSELAPVYRSEFMGVAGRADILKYCILEEFGGIYLDLDCECLRPFGCLEHGELVLQKVERVLPSYVPNAIMMSAKPRHPLWTAILTRDWAATLKPENRDVAVGIWGSHAILSTIELMKIPFENFPLIGRYVTHHSKRTWKGKP